ncbi:ATPase [Paraburkholderia sp. UYCP14C]|uniref:BCAM0308 family protein n=1 Tax=Paraburkholderia sp. UYCP14C TaxID=2511130 RepID=UPI001020E3B6|nr:BCAM0308 family protein [Paraburkholderia sp. UYCP14C]RZF25659.1 ATPase [Paraburkholderia sp. UYCP14C]
MNDRTRPFKPGEHFDVYPGLEQDPYAARGKLPEPAVCKNCGAVHQGGHWRWQAPPKEAEQVLCTACRRIADGLPAGYVHIDGEFATAHHDEVMQIVRGHEARAKAEHPMQRIMSVDEDGTTTVITTTDVHLARDIGTTLKADFQGKLELKYGPGESLVRVHWRR